MGGVRAESPKGLVRPPMGPIGGGCGKRKRNNLPLSHQPPSSFEILSEMSLWSLKGSG